MKHMRALLGTVAFGIVAFAGFKIYRKMTEGTVSRMKAPFIGPIFPYPITKNVVSSPFGEKRSTGPHLGIDLKTRFTNGVPDPNGTPDIGLILTAPFNGTVLNVFSDAHGGNQLMIEAPDGTKVGFAHLLTTSVKKGERFEVGDILGACGNTGSSTNAPHLHLTVRDPSGQLVDPAPYLGI